MKKHFDLKNQFFVLSTVLILTIIIGLVSSYANTTESNSINTDFKTIVNSNKDIKRIVDDSTVDGYKSYFSSIDKYDGRIWTDKSVYSYDSTGGTVTLDNNLAYVNSGKGLTTNFQSDFLNVFSVLGSNQAIKKEVIPLDIEFVLDVTSSMIGNELKSTLQATNKIIKKIKTTSPNSRIGIVFYWGTAHEIVPLTEYYPRLESDYTVTTDANGTKEALLTYRLENLETGRVISRIKYNPITGKSTVLSGTLPEGVEEKSNPLGGGTSNQAGIIAGLKALVENPNKTYKTSDGTELLKTPTLILLGDGEANHVLADTGDSDVIDGINYNKTPSSVTTSGNWWDPREPNVSVAAKNAPNLITFKSLLSAAYWKSAVAKAYNLPLDGIKIYTIGFKEGANNPILNPNKGFINSSNETRQKIYNRFLEWKSGSTEVLTIKATKSVGYDGSSSKGPYSLSRPDTVYNFNQLPKDDKYGVTMDSLDLNYVTKFYTTSSSDITKIYNAIYNNLLSYSYVENPIKANTTIKYSDPIGENLEIKNVNNLLLFGQSYSVSKREATQTEKNNQKNGITYTYYEVTNGSAVITNHGYDEYISDGRVMSTTTFKLSDIKIWIESNSSTNMQTLYIEIPNKALPILNIRYQTDENDVTTYISNENTIDSLPLRVLYTVGVKNSLIDKYSKVNLDLFSKDYISKNLAKKNNKEYVYLYSNLYDNSSKQGKATVNYTISDVNYHYLIQDYFALYKTSKDGDSNGEGILKETGGKVVLSDKITKMENIDKNETYYYIKEYYTRGENGQANLVQYATAVKGSDFTLVYYSEDTEDEASASGTDIVVAIKMGNENKNLNSTANKSNNVTNTASISSSSNYNNKNVIDYLGNNGRLEIINNRNLEIRKEVQGTSGDKNKTWTFEVKLTPKAGITLNTSYSYIGGSFVEGVTKPNNGTITLTKQSSGSYLGTIQLTHGQMITIMDIEEGTSYEIIEEEANTDNYTLKANNNKSILTNDKLVEMQNVKGITLPKTGELGTILPYFVGGLFIAWGITTFLLITKRKNKVE